MTKIPRSPLPLASLLRKPKHGWLAILFAWSLIVCLPALVPAQGLSRWVLGRPGALIDLPGNPGAGGVAWADQSLYSFLPTSWSAETPGCRVEVARLYGRQTPAEALGNIARKLGATVSAQLTGELSGRPFVGYHDASRLVMVVGPEAGAPYGTTWAFVASFNGAGGAEIANRVFDSIAIEREGRENWTLRSLGRTQLAAELPFELAAETRTNDPDTTKRYELHFNGLDIRVTQQEQGSGGRFDVDKTIDGIIADRRGGPG